MGGPLTSDQVYGPRSSRGTVKSSSSTEDWKRIHSELECYNLVTQVRVFPKGGPISCSYKRHAKRFTPLQGMSHNLVYI